MNDFHLNFTSHGLTAYRSSDEPKVSQNGAKETSGRINSVAHRTIATNLCDYWNAIKKSRIIRHVLFATGVALAVFYLVTPPGWLTGIVGALGMGGFAALSGLACLGTAMLLNIGLDKKGLLGEGEKLALETSFLLERFGGKNFSQITDNDQDEDLGNLFVGGLPTRGNDDLAKMKAAGITCVISITSPWERECRGPSLPYTREDYERAGIRYIEIESVDHKPLSMGDMDLISNIIKAQINSGENVLIHCRAGKGRSVLGVLAYLMNACGKTAEEAEKQIKSHRKQATIDKEKGRKAQADYQAHLFRQQYKIRSTNADMFVAQGDNTER